MSLAERVIYNPIFQSSCVFPTQRSHVCVDVHSPPPTALLHLYHRAVGGWGDIS